MTCKDGGVSWWTTGPQMELDGNGFILGPGFVTFLLLPWEHGVTSKVVFQIHGFCYFCWFFVPSFGWNFESGEGIVSGWFTDLLLILVGEIRDSQFPRAYIKFPAPFSYGHIESVWKGSWEWDCHHWGSISERMDQGRPIESQLWSPTFTTWVGPNRRNTRYVRYIPNLIAIQWDRYSTCETSHWGPLLWQHQGEEDSWRNGGWRSCSHF